MHAADRALTVRDGILENDGRHAWIHSSRVDRNARAEARASQCDAMRIDLGPACHVGQCIARVRHLLHRNDAAAFAAALAAAAEIDSNVT